MKRFAVVIEKAASNYAGYVPDLPGCIATGATPAETEELLREAIGLHLEGMREDGIEVPEPLARSSTSKYMPNIALRLTRPLHAVLAFHLRRGYTSHHPLA